MRSVDPSLPEGTRLCVECGYSLEELKVHRCPECGWPFNPEKRETYDLLDYSEADNLRSLARIVLSLLIVIIITLGLGTVTATESLVIMAFIISLGGFPILLVGFVMMMAYVASTHETGAKKWKRGLSMTLLLLSYIPAVILIWMVAIYGLG